MRFQHFLCLASAVPMAALHVPAALPVRRCARTCIMCDADAKQGLTPDVTEAATEIAKALAADKLSSQLDGLFGAPPPIEGVAGGSASLAYLEQRNELVGEVDSSELLRQDEANGFWPEENLPRSECETRDMLWVDQMSCIGCTWCADVARATFKMIEPYGTAQAIQQGGDPQEVVEEAIDCCPSDCIHHCTRAELELLELHRSRGHIDDLLARHHTGGRLMSEGEGGKGMAIPHWRDPILHQGWRKGDKYMRPKRLRLADPLIHHSGEKTAMSLIGIDKANETPSPCHQDGTVLGSAAQDASATREGQQAMDMPQGWELM